MMYKKLFTAILCLITMNILAQQGVTEIPKSDSLNTSLHNFLPKSTIISYDNYLKIKELVKSQDPRDSIKQHWPVTWEEFKKEFLEMKTEDPVADLDLHLPSPKELRNYAYPCGGIVVQGPISYLYDHFSKEARSKKTYADLTRKDAAAVRYNYVVITKVTGLQDEKEIKDYMDFCALPIEFILNASDYELYAAILDCYDEYCKNESDTIVPGNSE